MNKSLMRRLGGAICLAWAWAAPISAGDADSAPTSNKLEKLQTQIRSLSGEIRGDEKQLASLSDQLRETEKEIARLQHSIADLDKQLAAATAQLAELHADEARQGRFLEQQKEHLAQQVRATYALGKQQGVQVLLSQRDPASLGRTLTYLDYLGRARSGAIDATRKTLKELEQTRAEVANQQKSLAEAKAAKDSQQQALQDQRRQREQLMASIQDQLSDKKVQLASLQQDQKRLESLLEKLEREARERAARERERQRSADFAGLKGALPWPVDGKLAARFGTPRPAGDGRWRGVVISAAAGREVRAVAAGRVVFAEWLRGFGFLAIVDHGNGYMSLYGHNETLQVQTGDRVTQGEAIATVGRSGGQREPGVYFEIRHNGDPVDPQTWCRANA